MRVRRISPQKKVARRAYRAVKMVEPALPLAAIRRIRQRTVSRQNCLLECRDSSMESTDSSVTSAFEPADQAELTELFDRYRQRLRLMVHLRMDRRLQARIDSSDVLQEAFLEAAERYENYKRKPTMPPLLWLRFLV